MGRERGENDEQERCLGRISGLGVDADYTLRHRNISVSNTLPIYICVESRSPHERAHSTGMLDKERPFPDSLRLRGMARRLLMRPAMSFATVVDRARVDFMEMPELELTLPQAVRLWALGMDDCRYVIDALVDAGFLAWTPRRTIVRKGRDPLVSRGPQTMDILVRATPRYNKSVRE
jgi:hypothetical protein